MRSVIAAVALAQDSRMLFSPGALLPATGSQAQVAAVYDEMPLQIAQPVVYAQPAAAEDALDLSWVLPSVAVLAVGAAAGAYAAGSQRSVEEQEAEDEELDLEAALDAEQVLALAGPLVAHENRVAMLFGSGRNAKAAPKKAAGKKPAPKAAAKKPAPKPAARKPAPKPAPKAKPVAKKSAVLYQPNLQPAPWSPFKDLFSLALVGGGQGNTLAGGSAGGKAKRPARR